MAARHRGDQRHQAGLAALAGDRAAQGHRDRRAARTAPRRYAARRRSRATAPPCRGRRSRDFLPSRSVVRMVLLASATVSALGSDFGSFGVRTRLSASEARTPSRSRKRKKLLRAESARASERGTGTPGVAPAGEEGANVGGAQLLQRLRRHRAAAMTGEKAQELRQVAAISLDGVGGQPADRAEVALPSGEMPADGRVGGKGGIATMPRPTDFSY